MLVRSPTGPDGSRARAAGRNPAISSFSRRLSLPYASVTFTRLACGRGETLALGLLSMICCLVVAMANMDQELGIEMARCCAFEAIAAVETFAT